MRPFSGILAEIVHLKSNHERMRIQYEKLQQDALAKDARLLELETRLTAAKKMTTDLQQAVSTKNKEVEVRGHGRWSGEKLMGSWYCRN